MEFNEKELRREISYAIKNIHGIRQVLPCFPACSYGTVEYLPKALLTNFVLSVLGNVSSFTWLVNSHMVDTGSHGAVFELSLPDCWRGCDLSL